MREPGEIVAASFPRPGRALKAVLITLAVCAVLGGIIANWAPGGEAGARIISFFAFQPALIVPRFWTLLTSGLVTDPSGIGHALWSILGLYFLTPDLESRWGAKRLIRFLAIAVVVGNLAVFLVGLIRSAPAAVHPAIVFGPLAAIQACAVAWGKENANRQMRFMFFLTMTGRTFMWVTIASAVVILVFLNGMAEGAVAPLGGVAVGYLLAGSPSPARAVWLRIKLAFLRRKAGGPPLSIEALEGLEPRPRPTKRTVNKSGPALRVLQGGIEDDLKNRKPPKDKRYLN